VFYVSTSPWNLAELLEDFLHRHGFPGGPLFLTDWGPGRSGLLRIGAHAHKLTALRRIAQDLPGPRLVLLGDSGQADAEIYAAFAAEHPGRVAAVYIRRGGGRDACPARAARRVGRAAGRDRACRSWSPTTAPPSCARARRRTGRCRAVSHRDRVVGRAWLTRD
jgi:phosphatidate phosphatase APP1